MLGGDLLFAVSFVSRVSLAFRIRSAGDITPHGSHDGEAVHGRDGPVGLDEVFFEGRLEGDGCSAVQTFGHPLKRVEVSESFGVH